MNFQDAMIAMEVAAMNLTKEQLQEEFELASAKGILFNWSSADSEAYKFMSRVGHRFQLNRKQRIHVYKAVMDQQGIFNF